MSDRIAISMIANIYCQNFQSSLTISSKTFAKSKCELKRGGPGRYDAATPEPFRAGRVPCSLWVKGRRDLVSARCTLLPRKRTFTRKLLMSVLCYKQTFRHSFDCLCEHSLCRLGAMLPTPSLRIRSQAVQCFPRFHHDRVYDPPGDGVGCCTRSRVASGHI